jgi:hypothetical protein
MWNAGDALGLETVFEKVGRSLSENFGIRLVCRGDRCCTDGKTIYLPSLPEEIPKDLYLALRGYLDHEAAHIGFSSDIRALREFEAKWGKAGGFFLNVLEDVRVEAAMRRKYPGSGYNFANACRYSEQAILARPEPPSILRAHLIIVMPFWSKVRPNPHSFAPIPTRADCLPPIRSRIVPAV